MIQFHNVTYTYNFNTDACKDAIKNINLKVLPGEFLAIIGQTGSGKSTLVEHMNGLKKPTIGKVFVNGQDIWQKKFDITKVRFKVGLVFQYPEHQMFEQDVFSEIAFGLRNNGIAETKIESLIFEALDFVGLPHDILDSSPFDFSGGQKRKIAIASTIAMQPDVIILDEPTASLDPYSSELLLKKFKDYNKNKGKTVILVSHSMEEVVRFADRVIVMHNGEIKMEGEPRKIFTKVEELNEMGLDVPQILKVFLELKKLGFPVRVDIYTVEEAKQEFFRLKNLIEGEEGFVK
ncbi:MAG: energy-coupling factor transporter ATPase [Oscillospiraceae bacterium]